MYSEMVRGIVNSVLELWGIGLDVESCIAYMEDRLRELRAKSKFVSRYIRDHVAATSASSSSATNTKKKKNRVVVLQDVADAIGLGVTQGDLGLLLSVATARTPSLLVSVSPSDPLVLPLHSIRS